MFENGHGGVNSDHTPFDAMVNVVMSHFIGKICLILSCLGFTFRFIKFLVFILVALTKFSCHPDRHLIKSAHFSTFPKRRSSKIPIFYENK
jgi:hypothetical protein